MATYCPRYPLWTPRNGRRKFRSPVHNPSLVLLWTSRIPSPSSSRAHSRCPGVWQTVAWPRPRSGRCAYAAHSSVYTTAPSAVLSSTTRSSVARSASPITSRCACPVWRPTTPATGGRSVSYVPCPRRLLARRRGGSPGSRCGSPFFPRILVHLVRLDLRVGQGGLAAGGPLGQRLHPVTQAQPLTAVPPELAGQLGSRHPLADAAQDEHQLGAGAVDLLQGRAGEGVEDAATGRALVIQDRGAVAAV